MRSPLSRIVPEIEILIITSFVLTFDEGNVSVFQKDLIGMTGNLRVVVFTFQDTSMMKGSQFFLIVKMKSETVMFQEQHATIQLRSEQDLLIPLTFILRESNWKGMCFTDSA